MRARLVECALLVFAEKGVGASVIQDVIAAADVAQGTFYNHFRTNEELLVAVSQELNNELMRLIESEVGAYDDPARRIASGLRLYLHTARQYPLLARFVCQVGLLVAGPNNLIYEYLPPHIAAGQESGKFQLLAVEVALDLIAGTMLAAVQRLATDEPGENYPEQVVTAILRGLGLSSAQANRLVALPLAPLAPLPGSLMERGHARMSGVGSEDVRR